MQKCKIINNTVMEHYVREMKLFITQLKQIGVNYFTFDSNYNDGSHIRLTTHPEWIKHYYQKKLYNTAIFEKDYKLFNDSYLLWDWISPSPVYKAASEFGISNGITIIRRCDLKAKFYHFGFNDHNLLEHNDFLNKITTLQSFINYFNDKAQYILNEAESNRIIIPDLMSNKVNAKNDDGELIKDLLSFYDKNTRKLQVDKFKNSTYITKQERKILKGLNEGLKIKEIADIHCRSIKTIDNQLCNLRKKLNCKTLYELGRKSAQLKL